jgi:hypothetical protein
MVQVTKAIRKKEALFGAVFSAHSIVSNAQSQGISGAT